MFSLCVKQERECESCFPLAASPCLQFKYIAARIIIVHLHLFSPSLQSVSSCERVSQSQRWKYQSHDVKKTLNKTVAVSQTVAEKQPGENGQWQPCPAQSHMFLLK